MLSLPSDATGNEPYPQLHQKLNDQDMGGTFYRERLIAHLIDIKIFQSGEAYMQPSNAKCTCFA